MKKINEVIRRLRFTLIMLTGLVLAALLTNTVFQEITQHWLTQTGFSANDLWYWRLERLFTSAFVTSGKLVFWEALFLVAFFVGLAEWMSGWKQTAATFWGTHLFSLIFLSVVMMLSAHQFRNIGLAASELARDVGPSAGYFACLGLVGARIKHPWNWVSAGVVLLFFLISLFIPASTLQDASQKFSADLVHLIAFPTGWVSSFLSAKKHPSTPFY
jgi:hypothetical protein